MGGKGSGRKKKGSKSKTTSSYGFKWATKKTVAKRRGSGYTAARQRQQAGR
jgi:hypothetical protein